MSKPSRLCLTLLFTCFAGVLQAQTAPPQPQQQQQRAAEQPGNNAPVWREVRKEGQEHYTSVKGREAEFRARDCPGPCSCAVGRAERKDVAPRRCPVG